MIRNYDRSAKINDTQNSPYIPDHTSIIGGSGSCFTKLNEKMTRYWHKIYIKFIYLSKIHSNHKVTITYQWKRKSRIENLKNPNAFIDYWQTIDVYENLEDYNSTKEKKCW